jgi:hypothetical protein
LVRLILKEMSKSKSKQEEALQFLDDLDSLSPTSGTTGGANAHANPQGQDPTEVLAFLDEITQKSSEPARLAAPQIDRPSSRAGTPTLRKASERVRVGSSTPLLRPSSSSASLSTAPESTAKDASKPAPETSQPQTSSSWGWGSVWSSANAAIQQARTVVDEQVRNLPANEQARKVIEYAKTAQLDKLGLSLPSSKTRDTRYLTPPAGQDFRRAGQDFKRVGLSTLTDILNVVAPPISKHEVIQVWLSHDMKGYEGTESLVYRALARVSILFLFSQQISRFSPDYGAGGRRRPDCE